MTDHELLEFAARAIGCSIEFPVNHAAPLLAVDENTYQQWSPLTDDGDALRLLCQLKQEAYFAFHDDHEAAHMSWPDGARKRYCIEYLLDHKEDAASALRRAIVRAAAEIGKSK